jgi:hypothetical protein
MRPFLERLATDTGLGEWPAYFTQTDSVSFSCAAWRISLKALKSVASSISSCLSCWARNGRACIRAAQVEKATARMSAAPLISGETHSDAPSRTRPDDTKARNIAAKDFYNTHRPHRALHQAAPLCPLPDGVTDLSARR